MKMSFVKVVTCGRDESKISSVSERQLQINLTPSEKVFFTFCVNDNTSKSLL